MRIQRAPAFMTVVSSLSFFLIVAGSARAASITVDNRVQPLSAFEIAFDSHSLTADVVTQKVTFSGMYVSTGGFPALNDTVSYLIGLGAPADEPSLGSVLLTIKGISDASHNNTQVDMVFNALVSGPIQPDFSVLDPGSSIDVAAFLRQQNAAGVPTDLSVVILSAVPEPASLVLGSMALIVGLGIASRRPHAG